MAVLDHALVLLVQLTGKYDIRFANGSKESGFTAAKICPVESTKNAIANRADDDDNAGTYEHGDKVEARVQGTDRYFIVPDPSHCGDNALLTPQCDGDHVALEERCITPERHFLSPYKNI